MSKINKKILIVEDDKPFSLLLSTYLEENDLQIDLAYSVEESFKYIAEESYDLIISDFNLLDGNANDLLTFLKVRNLYLPTVILSSTKIVVLKEELIDYDLLELLEKDIKMQFLSHLKDKVCLACV